MLLVTKQTFSRGRGFHIQERFVTESSELAEDYKNRHENLDHMIYVDIDDVDVRNKAIVS